MKKLLITLMVLASLVSCGKDNKVSSGSSTSNGYTNGILTGNASAAAQALVAAVNNPSVFGQGAAYMSTGSTGQTCGTKWGFINYCYGSSTSSGSVAMGKTWNQIIAETPSVVFQYTNGNVRNGQDVTVASQQTFIMNLLNTASNVQVYGTIYYITVGNDIWAVDTRYALQMNPSAKQTNGYTAYYFLRAI
jgi:hypothetical protein